MEPLPQKPVVIPQGRRLTRIFKSNQSKQFTEGDNVEIDIPPCNHSYMTKDCRIHFEFDMSYLETDNYQDIATFFMSATPTNASTKYQALADYFGRTVVNTSGVTVCTPQATDGSENTCKKPIPFLDSNGPYGFFSQIQIYDYLGNTLLEDVNAHDLLSSVYCDFDTFDPQLNRIRPVVTDLNESLISTSARPNSVNLFDSDSRQKNLSIVLFEPPHINSDSIVVNTTTNTTTVTAKERKITARYSIKLLNFLGDHSTKFAPLHNGYKIILRLNNSSIPVKFNMPTGIVGSSTNQLSLRYITSGTSGNYVYSPYTIFTFTPSITNYKISNIYLKSDILEITPELDAQVDKTLHVRMFHRHIISTELPQTPIPVQRKSMKSISIIYRPRQSYRETFNAYGFRLRTYINKASLYYNGALVKEFKTDEEFLAAMPSTFSDMIDLSDFTTDVIADINEGSRGLQNLWINRTTRLDLAQNVTTNQNIPYAMFNPDEFNDATNYTNYSDGKFMVFWDLSLLGYDGKNLTGVDTSKTYLTYQVSRSTAYPYPLYIDALCEYDAFLHVDPGKTTSVSF